jgi:hypothetical protein
MPTACCASSAHANFCQRRLLRSWLAGWLARLSIWASRGRARKALQLRLRGFAGCAGRFKVLAALPMCFAGYAGLLYGAECHRGAQVSQRLSLHYPWAVRLVLAGMQHSSTSSYSLWPMGSCLLAIGPPTRQSMRGLAALCVSRRRSPHCSSWVRARASQRHLWQALV